ncbi:hypothetical protein [Clavibacter zhangzhiyongii]|uniref:hypothetical protein n=1 Tax=Clavibacter zhangzhiyongii TaxID=2768071 RepID=UPI0039DF386A
MSATRDWDGLLRMLSTVDAVHGLYYALMHVWFDLVGYSPTSLRFPSAVFVGLAAAGVVLLTRTVSTRATGVVAGIAFVAIPRVGLDGHGGPLLRARHAHRGRAHRGAGAGGPARGIARRRVQAAWWALYGLIAWFGASTFIYLALLVGAHGAVIMWSIASARVGRRTLRPMMVSLLGWAHRLNLGGAPVPAARGRGHRAVRAGRLDQAHRPEDARAGRLHAALPRERRVRVGRLAAGAPRPRDARAARDPPGARPPGLHRRARGRDRRLRVGVPPRRLVADAAPARGRVARRAHDAARLRVHAHVAALLAAVPRVHGPRLRHAHGRGDPRAAVEARSSRS